jgi:hypothetical protein
MESLNFVVAAFCLSVYIHIHKGFNKRHEKERIAKLSQM